MLDTRACAEALQRARDVAAQRGEDVDDVITDATMLGAELGIVVRASDIADILPQLLLDM